VNNSKNSNNRIEATTAKAAAFCNNFNAHLGSGAGNPNNRSLHLQQRSHTVEKNGHDNGHGNGHGNSHGQPRGSSS
jgi:hypothetical protein